MRVGVVKKKIGQKFLSKKNSGSRAKEEAKKLVGQGLSFSFSGEDQDQKS